MGVSPLPVRAVPTGTAGVEVGVTGASQFRSMASASAEIAASAADSLSDAPASSSADVDSVARPEADSVGWLELRSARPESSDR